MTETGTSDGEENTFESEVVPLSGEMRESSLCVDAAKKFNDRGGLFQQDEQRGAFRFELREVRRKVEVPGLIGIAEREPAYKGGAPGCGVFVVGALGGIGGGRKRKCTKERFAKRLAGRIEKAGLRPIARSETEANFEAADDMNASEAIETRTEMGSKRRFERAPRPVFDVGGNVALLRSSAAADGEGIDRERHGLLE